MAVLTARPRRIIVPPTLEIVGKIKDELIDHCTARHRLVVGGRGKGASWSIARYLLWEATQRPLFIVCIREVQDSIKLSVKKLLEDTYKSMGWEGFFSSTLSEIRGKNGSLFTFHGLHDHNADSIKSLEGADRAWIAEAQSIQRRSLDILRPTVRKDGSVVWWDLNPRYDTDPVYMDYVANTSDEMLLANDCKVCFVSWKDNPWFTKALRSEMEADYARDPVRAAHIWEGVLVNVGKLHVITSDIFDQCVESSKKAFDGPIEVGADIAHQGGDEIVFYKRRGRVIVDDYFARFQDTGTTARDLMAFTEDPRVRIKIDNGNIGAAVADLVIKAGFGNTMRINFGGRPNDIEHYDNTVTEMYFQLREVLRLEGTCIQKDDELRAQLTGRRYSFITGRKGYEVMSIESKESYSSHRLSQSKSPDRADALALTFYDPHAPVVLSTMNVQAGFAGLNYDFIGGV